MMSVDLQFDDAQFGPRIEFEAESTANRTDEGQFVTGGRRLADGTLAVSQGASDG